MELCFDSNLQYDNNIHHITCHGRVDQVLHIENAGLLEVLLADDEESLASSARTSPDKAAASWLKTKNKNMVITNLIDLKI